MRSGRAKSAQRTPRGVVCRVEDRGEVVNDTHQILKNQMSLRGLPFPLRPSNLASLSKLKAAAASL